MALLLATITWIMLLLSATATPEIPSKGKHTRIQDAQQTSVEDADMPRFAEPIANVTVSIGRDALLACVVENLKSYKVAWVRVDTQTILSIHHNVISQNNRISLTYNDHRSWYLHIKEVEESDRGWYMCQVNTDPMRSRKGYLQVVVPPMIVEGMTSNDMVVREGLNVTLTCKARGYPEPYVMWRREDGEEMLIGGEHVNVVDGEMLHITKVSRLHMAAYLCVASNGVPPSISKRVHLRVQFPPMLSIPNQLEGAYVGQDVVLECHTEAYPASINYWTTERGDMIISDTSRAGDKYETTSTISGYTKYMKLKIRSVGLNDFGTYRCVAKNSLGETDGNIKLDEMPMPTTAIISEMALLNRSLDGKHRHRNKFDLNALPDYGVEEWRDGAGNGIGGGGIGNTGDNNQTPVRNPPGAFRNSASSLAQRNLLGGIIHWIKMQSLGIFKRLSSRQQYRRRASHANVDDDDAHAHAHAPQTHAQFAVVMLKRQQKQREGEKQTAEKAQVKGKKQRTKKGIENGRIKRASELWQAAAAKATPKTKATTTRTTTVNYCCSRQVAAALRCLWRRLVVEQRSVALILRLLLLAVPFLRTINHNNKSNNNQTITTTTTAERGKAALSELTTTTIARKQESNKKIVSTTTTTAALHAIDLHKNKPMKSHNSNTHSGSSSSSSCIPAAYDSARWWGINNQPQPQQQQEHPDNSNGSYNDNQHNNNSNNNANNMLQIISNIVAAHIDNNNNNNNNNNSNMSNVTCIQVLSLRLVLLLGLLFPFPLLSPEQTLQTLPTITTTTKFLLFYICIVIFSSRQVAGNFLPLSSLLFFINSNISNTITSTTTIATTTLMKNAKNICTKLKAAIFSSSSSNRRHRHNSTSTSTSSNSSNTPLRWQPQIAKTSTINTNNISKTKTTTTTIKSLVNVAFFACNKFEFSYLPAR